MIVLKPLAEYVPKALIEAIGSEQVMDYLLENIAEAARDKWVRLAQAEFKSTRQDYVAGIQPVEMRQPGMAVVVLVGSLANALENGQAARDLRDTLLGPSVPTVPRGKRGKHMIDGTGDDPNPGYYRSIPFRHKGPDARGGFGEAMGAALSPMVGPKKARQIGRAIYEMAKKLKPTKTVYGDHPADAPPQASKVYGEHLVLPPGPITRFYGGMIREEKDYEKAVGKKAQSQFVTFRTISTQGAPWVHPGLKARNLAAQVMRHTSKIAAMTFEQYAKGAKGE